MPDSGINYDELATKYGGSVDVDYDSMAKKFGGSIDEPKPTSTAPIPDIKIPTVQPTSTPSRDFNRAMALPGVTNPQKTAWERTQEFATKPLVGHIPVEGGVPNIGSLEIGEGSWEEKPVTKRVSDVLAERGGGPVAGAARAAGNLAAGLTSPVNLAMATGIGTLPKLARAGAGALFTAEQVMQLPEQVRSIGTTFQSPEATSGDKVQAVGEFLGTTALGVAGAKGAMHDFRTSPQVQAHVAPRIASDFNAAQDMAYDLGRNRLTRGAGRSMMDSAVQGTGARMAQYELPWTPLPPRGSIVGEGPAGHAPLPQEVTEGNQRTRALMDEVERFAQEPPIPSRELPPRQIKSAQESARVFQTTSNAPFQPLIESADRYRKMYGNAPSQNVPLPNREARRATTEVPEQGPSIQEQRIMDAAQRAGMDYATLTPEDRAVLTELVDTPDPTRHRQTEPVAAPPPLRPKIESNQRTAQLLEKLDEVQPPPPVEKPPLPPRPEPVAASIPPSIEVAKPEVPLTATESLAPPTPRTEPEPTAGKRLTTDTYRVPTKELHRDPQRFQYKVEGIGQGGVGSKLKDVDTWDDRIAGTVFAWTDPANGKDYVVNGHHRHELAERLNVPDLRVQYITAPDAKSARAAGALMNIGEGNGTAIDAAKFMRDTGASAAELKAKGLLSSTVAREGAALSNLSPSLFDDVIHGQLEPKRAVIIGSQLPDHADQAGAMAVLRDAEKRGRHLDDAEVKELIRRTANAPRTVETQDTLFGVEEMTQNHALEEAQLSNFIRNQLGQEKKLFGTVGSQSAAERLGAVGNKIDAAANQGIADQAAQTLAAYDKLSLSEGPVTDALRTGARRLASGEKPEAVRADTYAAIRDSVAALFGGKQVRAAVAGADVSGNRGSGGSVQKRGDKAGAVKQETAKALNLDPESAIDSAILEDLTSGDTGKQVAALKKYRRRTGETGAIKLPFGNKPNLPPSEQYAADMVAKREAARRAMKRPRTIGTAREFWQTAKANLVDTMAPVEDLFDSVIAKDKGTYSIRPSQELEGAIAKVYRAPTLAGQFAKDKGLVKLIQDLPTERDVDNLDQLLIARHAAELDPAIKTGRDAAKDAQLVKDLTPKYQAQLDGIRNYVRELEDYMVSSGLKSQKDIDSLRKRYPDYADFHRVLPESMTRFSNVRGAASKGSTNVIQKLVGSDKLEIDSPLGNLLEKTHATFLEGQQNLAAKTAAEYSKLPGADQYVREVPPKIATKMDPADYFTYLDQGQKRYYAAPRAFVAAAKSLNAESMGLLGKAFYSVVRVFKAGTTAFDPIFAVGNIARDQFTRSINQAGIAKTAQKVELPPQGALTTAGNLTGLHPTVAKASVDAVLSAGRNFATKDSPLYDEMVRNAGGGNSFDLYRNQPVLSVQGVRAKKNAKTRTKNLLRGGLRELEDFISISEDTTRLQAYSTAKADALAAGMGEADAQAVAAKTARQSTADFYRGGNWKRVMMAVYPYINANIQGTRASVRTAGRDPIGFSIRAAANVGIPAALITLYNTATPERKKAWDDIQDWEKDKSFIILPEHPKKDAMGRWDAVKIPMAPGISEVGGLVRKNIEARTGGDPVKASDYLTAAFNFYAPLSGTGEQIIGQTVPQAFKPTVEATFNKNFYTNKPVQPGWMDRLPLKDRRFDSTSGTAQMIGEGLGVAPVKVEHVIKGFGGGVTTQALRAADVGRKAIADRLPDSPAAQYLRDLPVGGESTTEKFGRRFMAAQGGSVDEREMAETAKAKDVVAEENAPDERLARQLFKEWQSKPDETLAKAEKLEAEGKLSDEARDKLIDLVGAHNADMQRWEKELRTQPTKVRAERISKMLDGKSPEEMDSIEANLTSKKILTPAVIEAIAERMATRNNRGTK